MNVEKSEIVEKITANLPELIASAERAEIWDSDGYNQAADLAKFISESMKTIEAERKRITAPLNESLKATNFFFKKASDPLDRALLLIKSKILDYQRKERERAEEIARKLAEETKLAQLESNQTLEAEDHEIKAVASLAPQVARGDFGKVITQKRWGFTCKDIASVPLGYLMLNESAVKKAISEGVRDIPGLDIYQVESAVVR